jgi:hypothetical protein
MKTHDVFLMLLSLAAAAAGCSSQVESPQSRGDNADAVISSDAPVSAAEHDRQAEAPTSETGTGTLEPGVERKAEPVYAVAEYDAKRDPQMDLDAAVQQASRDGKRILLEIGGNW